MHGRSEGALMPMIIIGHKIKVRPENVFGFSGLNIFVCKMTMMTNFSCKYGISLLHALYSQNAGAC